MEPNAVVRALIRDRAKLLGYICVIVRDHHVAEDVFGDVTVLAMERAGEINDEAHLALWARKAARLKALEAVRRRNRGRRGTVSLDDDVIEMIEADWGVVDAMPAAAEVDHLRSCIERLTPRARRILHLRYVEGLGGASLAAHAEVGIDLRSLYVAMS